MTFEVGKTYSNKRTRDHAKVLLIVGDEVVLRWAGEGRCIVAQQDWFKDTWFEYKEPVVEKITRLFCKDNTCGYYTTDLPKSFYQVGKVEFTVTDGKLTNVEIIE